MSEPVIPNRSPQPTGTMPREMRKYVTLALAAIVMVIIISSAMSTSSPPQTVQPVGSSPRLPNPGSLQQSQAELAAAMRNDLARQQKMLAIASAQIPLAGPQSAALDQTGQPYYPQPSLQGVPVVDPVQEERKRRQALAPFASNIALSYRKEVQEPPRANAAQVTPERSAATTQPIPPEAAPDAPKERTFLLYEGTIVEAVLTNRLIGDFAGPVNCMVTGDVYSSRGGQLVIPSGTRILGTAQSVGNADQQRLAISFHRMIRPDGVSVKLSGTPGLDQQGATALKDKVDHHYMSTFGTSIALGLLAGFSLYGTSGVYSDNASGTDMYRQGVASQVGRDAQSIMSRRLNRLPNITIREGHRVKVLLSADLNLPAFEGVKR